MSENKLIFEIEGDTKAAEKSIDDVGSKFASMAKVAAASAAAFLSFRAISSFSSASIDAATEAERSLNKFNLALASSGQFSKEASSKFQDFADSLEKTTGISDDIILKNSSLLVSIGKLSGDGLERATQASLDLARGLDMDVSSAFEIMSKAAQGNVDMLTRYGLEVQKGATDSEKFSAALQFVETRFNGLASSSANTFEGVMTKLSNSIGKVTESLGMIITKSPKLMAFIQIIADKFYKLSEAIQNANLSIDRIIDALFKLAKIVTKYLLGPIEMLLNFFVVGLMTLLKPIIAAVELLADFVDRFLGTKIKDKISVISKQFEIATDKMIEKAQNFDTSVTQSMGNFIDKSKAKIDDLASKMETDVPKSINKGIKEISKGVEQSTVVSGSFFDGFIDGLKSIAGNVNSLGKNVAGSLANGFVNAFSAMGKAIAQGGDAFGEFGRAALSMIGNIAIQIGSFLILAGLGFSLIPGFQASAGAVVAGVALTVLGGILQALGGGGAKAASAAGSSAGVASGADVGFNPMIEPTQEQEREKAQTGVQVIVQGNILDRRETGLEIAQILSESFDTNGTIVRGFA